MQTLALTIRTSSLQVAYEQTGPDSGDAIILLHGFPYDVRQFDAVRDCVAAPTRRIIVPCLRGFGATHYMSKEMFRSGQQAALGKDVVDLLDALEIEQAVLAGYDWGSRAACVAAALWPDRVRGIISVGGYTIEDIAAAAQTPASAEQERAFWYQWYFQTERGRRGLEQNRDELCRLMWRLWSPTWQFQNDLFRVTAESFHNTDFVETVIHSYRHRYGNAVGDPAFEQLEERLANKPVIRRPAIVLHGENDSVTPPSTSEGQEHLFTNSYERRVLLEVGHCPPAESPHEVGEAIDNILRRISTTSNTLSQPAVQCVH